MRREPNRNPDLDRLRGIAILLVLGAHYFPDTLSFGWIGVDLFFVLSGFLLGGTLIDQRGSENYFGTFYARRVARIVPVYGLLLATWAIGAFAAGLPANLAVYATFTQNIYWSLTGEPAPTWVSVTWSLAVEEQFYLMLPLIVFLASARYLPRVLMALICIAPAIRAFLLLAIHAGPSAAYMLMPCRMDSLFLGTLVAWAVRQPAMVSRVRRNMLALCAAIGIGASGLVTLIVSGWTSKTEIVGLVGYSWLAALAGLIVLVAIAFPSGLKAGPIAWIGERSYSIYLFHPPVAMLALLLPLPQIPTAFAITLVLCWALYRFIEKPILAAAHVRFRFGPRLHGAAQTVTLSG